MEKRERERDRANFMVMLLSDYWHTKHNAFAFPFLFKGQCSMYDFVQIVFRIPLSVCTDNGLFFCRRCLPFEYFVVCVNSIFLVCMHDH